MGESVTVKEKQQRMTKVEKKIDGVEGTKRIDGAEGTGDSMRENIRVLKKDVQKILMLMGEILNQRHSSIEENLKEEGAESGENSFQEILKDDQGSSRRDLLTDLEDALLKQRPNCESGFKLNEERENRYQSQIQHQLNDLEELPSSRGEDLQTKCLLELYGLKLAELQRKVRSDVSSEYWLNVKCAYPDRQLFDWGMCGCVVQCMVSEIHLPWMLMII